ncbi:MAG: hypothetical protein E7639_01400 [Ruminococcaceae bacterium]|nr:hypothetical protein [Oscillospiraceae bacterium]
MEFREFVHAPACRAFCGKPLTLQLLVPEEGILPSVYLLFEVMGEKPYSGKVRMHPCDGYRAEQSYTVLSATIEASHTVGDRLTYRFLKDNDESAAFTVPLCAPDLLPPLVITESAVCAPPYAPYLELKNVSDAPLDLFFFDLLTVSPDGTHRRTRLAEEEGRNMLPIQSTCALFFVGEPVTEKSRQEALAAIFTAYETKFPMACAELSARQPLYFFVPVVPAEDCPEGGVVFGRNHFGDGLFVVPHGKGVDEAVYAVKPLYTPEQRDSRYRMSAVWQFSSATPREGQLITPKGYPTPGFLGEWQSEVDFTCCEAPAVLPILPQARTYLADGDARISFAVIGGGTVSTARVFLRIGARYESFVATMDTNGYFTVVLPFSKVSRLGEALYYYIEVQGGLYAAALGSAEKPLVSAICDNCGPEILCCSPAPYQVLENEFSPEISIAYYDISDVNLGICALCLDGLNVSEHATWEQGQVRYTAKELAYGTHTVEITLRDMRGNRTYEKYDFAISDGREMSLFCGQVHSHTADSDGRGTPEEAYLYARDRSHMDYFAVTDHSHCFAPEDYEAQRAIADRYDAPGKFAALYGFEMTWHDVTGIWGHINVLNTKWICQDPEGVDLPAFNAQLAQHPEGIGMFNHPEDAWGDANEFHPFGEALRGIYALYEMNAARYHQGYALALAKGWRLGPLFNEDNHGADWGASGGMGFVLAPALTRENILDGMRRRRTYTTNDRTMRVFYRVNGEWLGSVLHAPTQLDVEINVTTEHEGGIGRLELLAEDSIVVAEVEAGALSEFCWRLELPPDFDYYYLRITGANTYTVTAPIFVEGRDALTLQKLQYGISEDAEHPHVVLASVKNTSDKVLTDVTVDLYLTDENAFTLRRLAPFEEVHVGKLAAGEVRTVSRRLPDVPRGHRVVAVVSGNCGKERYADTGYVMISPLTVTKLMPLTSAVEHGGAMVENPFAYVEIYNHTQRTVDLKGYSLGAWRALGVRAVPTQDRVLSLDGYTLPPQSTLVVWAKQAGNPLSAADFNAHYGVNLLEGEDLLITESFILPTSNGAKKLDIRRGEEILTRATYGYHCTHDTDVVCDKPLCYVHAPHRTVTARFLPQASQADLLPGQIVPQQVPRTLKGLCRKREAVEAERSAVRREVFTRLTKASLVPFRAAAFVANAVSAFKGFFDTKE